MLGDERMGRGPRHSTILLSHLHWDHVAGLPFFTPIYVPGHRVEIASGPNGVMSLDAAMRDLFRAPFFPVDYATISDQVSTRELRANDKFQIGDITMTMAKLNHPDPVYGFRLAARRPVDRVRDRHGALRVRGPDAEEARSGCGHLDS